MKRWLCQTVIQLFHEGKIEQSGSPVEMYTGPKTKFAASFIGSYNIIEASEFVKLTGVSTIKSREIAIRPETIQIERVLKGAESGKCIILKEI